MRKRGVCGAIVSFLLTAVLTMPAASAVAEGCTAQLGQDFLTGWSHDLPKLLSIFTDDIVYEDTTVHAVLRGKEELRGFAEGWFKAFPDLSFTLTSAVISEDHATVEWQVTGTQRGDMPGMPASNKVANIAVVSVMECADGKIRHNVDYYDMTTVMRQLGFLPPATK
jgi:steroid delta-isomerase-like uncharacterized protein